MGLKAGKDELQLRLEHDGATLYEISAGEVKSEITIGRSADCQWVIPPTDKSASNRHAAIVRRRGALYVVDTKSRNGVFFQGAKVAEHRLSPGDQLGIGDCRLYVERPQRQGAGPEYEFNRLEQLNGEKRGTLYNLDKEKVRLGSSSECEIVLNDSVISHFHAVIEQRPDGSSWIRDMGSRNGTSVNGSRLSGMANDSGRLLKDGDVITISYIELRFWDKYAVHVRSHLLLKAFACLLTFGLLLGGYYAWQTTMPSAKSQIDQARDCARRCEFAEAVRHLEAAANARQANRYQEERKELLAQVRQWDETLRNWQEVKTLLGNGKWVSANKILSPMLSQNMELWRWNDTDANLAKNEAIAVKQLIDAYLEGRNTLEDNEASRDRLARSAEALTREADALGGGAPDYCRPLLEVATDIRDELRLTVADLQTIEEKLHALDALGRLETVIRDIQAVRAKARTHRDERTAAGLRVSPTVVRLADDVLEPLTRLQQAKAVLEANYATVASLQFDRQNWTLPLPTVEECAVYPVMADVRLQIERANKQLRDDSQQLAMMCQSLAGQGFDEQRVPDCLEILHEPGNLQKALDCDCFDGPLPLWSRTEPTSTYDRLLGIEPFYEFLSQLPGDFDAGILEDLPFKPAIYQARMLYSYMEMLMTFQQRESLSGILAQPDDNRFVKLAGAVKAQLSRRDRLVADLVERSRASDKRDGVIAGGMALLLGRPAALPDGFAEEVQRKWRRVRQETTALLDGEMTPEKALEVNRQVMAVGFPGDTFVKQAWAEQEQP